MTGFIPREVRRAILIGGVLAGTVDLADAVLFSFVWRGVTPDRVLKAIASGLVGSAAFSGGLPTMLLGLAIHFWIAFTVAAVYAMACHVLWPGWVRGPGREVRHTVVAGLVYGLAVYFVMQQVVLPLSAFRAGTFAWPSFINGVLIHACGVGLPIAWAVHREFVKGWAPVSSAAGPV